MILIKSNLMMISLLPLETNLKLCQKALTTIIYFSSVYCYRSISEKKQIFVSFCPIYWAL